MEYDTKSSTSTAIGQEMKVEYGGSTPSTRIVIEGDECKNMVTISTPGDLQ